MFFLGLVWLLPILGHSQMLTPTVVASSGGFYYSSAANASLSVTVGEMAMVETFFAAGHFLTQGFQQPEKNLDGIWVDESDVFELFEVFPNPATTYLNIRYQLRQNGTLHLRFFNLNGTEVVFPYQHAYMGGLQEDELDVTGLSQGMYFLEVSFETSPQAERAVSFHKINIIR